MEKPLAISIPSEQIKASAWTGMHQGAAMEGGSEDVREAINNYLDINSISPPPSSQVCPQNWNKLKQININSRPDAGPTPTGKILHCAPRANILQRFFIT